MIENPNIRAESIAACLRRDYGIEPASVEFLPLGFDLSAAVYRVAAVDGRAYFLKIRFAPLNPLSVTVPRALNAADVPEAVAPLPTITGAPWGEIDGHAALLYPFIEGEGRYEMTLTPGQWRSYGAILRRIHDVVIPDDLHASLPRETFVPHAGYSAAIGKVDALIADREFENRADREFAEFWKTHQSTIRRVHQRAIQLGRMLQANPPPFALCHADIHKGNLLREPDGRLHVVDWDQPVLAPKERDFVFILGGDPDALSAGESLFMEGYGAADIDRLALAYYRYEWCVQDIGSFGETILLIPDTGDDTKRESIYYFTLMFAAGERIAAADRLAAKLAL
jgi:spectinomycin phosphotransferase